MIKAGLTGKSLEDEAFTEEIINCITRIKGLMIEPLRPEDFTRAVDLMKDFNLDYEDALHLAVAMRTGVREIVSNDKDFDVAPIKRNI